MPGIAVCSDRGKKLSLFLRPDACAKVFLFSGRFLPSPRAAFISGGAKCIRYGTEKRQGVMSLKYNVEERARELAAYIIEHRTTVRAAAKRYGVSKNTVHKDVAQRLRDIDYTLYTRVREILLENKSERHIRGGIATRQKYAALHRSADGRRAAKTEKAPY